MSGIKYLTTPPYHLASNELTEQAVQTLKTGLKMTAGNIEDKLARFISSTGSHLIQPQVEPLLN